MFQADWFPRLPARPAGDLEAIRWVRYWDLAATEQTSKSSDPDYTVGALLGKTPANRYVLADIKRTRARPEGVERLLRATAEEDGKNVSIFIEQEPGSNAKIAVSHLMRNVLDGFTVRAITSSSKKIVRADPVSAQAEAGNISLVNGPWVEDFLAEAKLFPNGTHDDQIDGVSGAFAALQVEHGAEVQTRRPNPASRPRVDDGDLTLIGEQYVDQP
jgi:predicted phage terminase large subunit-like protein